MFALAEQMRKIAQPWYPGGTYIIDRNSHQEKGAVQMAYVDSICSLYLDGTVDSTRLVPFQSTGDGNCLLHAICKAICGRDDEHAILREKMTQELVENEPWYRFHLQQSKEEWAKSLEMAGRDGNYLGSEHILALANYLQRPIILLDNKEQAERFGQGEGGVTAIFLPTRHPVPPALAPPLMIAWATSEHLHYVPIVPALLEGEEFPRLELPAAAYPRTIPSGTHVEDYVTYTLAASDARCVLEFETKSQIIKRVIELSCGQELVLAALSIVQRFGLARDRIPFIVSYLREFAQAHAVPVSLSDASFRLLKDVTRCGVFPTSALSIPPEPAFQKTLEILKTCVTELGELKPEHATAFETVFSVVPGPMMADLDLTAFQILLDYLPKFSKTAVAVGLLYAYIAQSPSHVIYEVAKRTTLIESLLKLVNKDTTTGVMVILLRCFATLLDPKLYGLLSFSIVYHPELRLQTQSLVETLATVHFPSLASYLHNYALYIAYSQLWSQRVRDEHINHIASFLSRCIALSPADRGKPEHFHKAVEDCLIAIGNIAIAQPEQAPVYQPLLTPTLDELKSLPINLSLITDLNTLLERKVETHNIPRIESLLT